MTDTLIKNAIVVNEGEQKQTDVLISNGRIEKIAADISATEDMQVVDAKGLYLMPGMIDDQVHFREPGVTYKADIATESRAAVAGGITSFMEMPNTIPQTVTLDALEAKYELAADRSMANFSFYFGATNDNIDQIRALGRNQTCGIKVFMGASTGNMLVDNIATLEAIFKDAPCLISTHCEDTPTILKNEAIYREKYGEDVPMAMHPLIRSEEACYMSSSMAIKLAKEQGARLHVLHLTTEKELEQFEAGPIAGKQITAEACVHHLYFSDQDYADKGSFIKCNPAIKKVSDRAAIRKALAADKLDLIGTDHAPHTLEEKNSTYFNAPAGLPLVQHALAMALELYHDGDLTLEQVVHKVSHAPAEIFGVQNRGYIREGYCADLVLVDMTETAPIQREQILYKCGWSPMEGEVLKSQVVTTWVNGQKVWDKGLLSDVVAGQRLVFQR